MTSEPRSAAQRRADTLALLAAPVTDAWVASASAGGDGSAQAHLVPLSLAWIDDRVVLALEGTSRTARNITAHGTARLALGPTRDVVMIDAVLERVVPTTGDGDAGGPADGDPDGSARLGEGYAAQADWDPRGSAGYVFLVLRPERVQAWRDEAEIPGRTLMRSGDWLV
jgi:hypothetical protein